MKVYCPGLSVVDVILPLASVTSSYTFLPVLSYMATFAPGTGAAVVRSVFVMVTRKSMRSSVNEVVPVTLPS